MGKKTVFTNITPLPPQVSREVAISMLHNHDEMIELNPLVIEHHPIQAPPNAAKDEIVDCVWQEMTDRIHYLPGGIVKGKVTYKGCFYDFPNGLQTHVYAPMNLNIRERWTVCGTLPGEPDEPRELGINVPRRGLYLREDGEMKCNMLMTSFVRKNLDNAHKVLVERILAKAERVQAHLDSRTNSPASSIPSGMPGISSGSYTTTSSIAQQLSGQQTPQSTERAIHTRTSSDSAAVQSVRAPLRQQFVQELPGSTPDEVQKPLPAEPEEEEVDEAELQTVHPALREQYRQSRTSTLARSDTGLPAYHTLKNQQGQFYQTDLAKRPQGKQFAVELEGDSSVPQGEASTATAQSTLGDHANGYTHVPDRSDLEASWRPRTTYGATSEISDGEKTPPRQHSSSQSRNRSQTRNDEDSYISNPTLPTSGGSAATDRYSIVSGISDLPTPKAGQFAINNGDIANNRFSVVSALTESPTPRFSQQTFAQQQAFALEQARQAQARHSQGSASNMF